MRLVPVSRLGASFFPLPLLLRLLSFRVNNDMNVPVPARALTSAGTTNKWRKLLRIAQIERTRAGLLRLESTSLLDG